MPLTSTLPPLITRRWAVAIVLLSSISTTANAAPLAMEAAKNAAIAAKRVSSLLIIFPSYNQSTCSKGTHSCPHPAELHYPISERARRTKFHNPVFKCPERTKITKSAGFRQAEGVWPRQILENGP